MCEQPYPLWKRKWKEETSWSAKELAKLCCGWDPDTGWDPDCGWEPWNSGEALFDEADVVRWTYNDALAKIRRAERVGDLHAMDLPKRATPEELDCGDASVFRSREAAAWAAKRFPDFPYKEDDWLDASESTTAPADEQRRATSDSMGAATGVAPELLTIAEITSTALAARHAVKAYVDEVSIFRQTSDGLWEVAFKGQKRVGLKNLKGMELIRRLLANSGLLIAAFQLVAGSGAVIESGAVPDEDQEDQVDDAFNEGVFATAAPWTGMPTLDAQAKREIKAQLIALRENRQSAQERGDQVEEAKIDDEVAAIEDQLRLDSGLGGRPRRMGSDAEKARHTASRRYRTALDYLREQLPALAEHLKRCIRPGAKFVYQPPADIITWLT